DRLSFSGARSAFRQDRGDVFVGKTVKAVAADAGFGQIFWQGEHLRQLWVSMVKSSIKTRDLRNVRHAFHHDFDGREIVWLMQRRERDELFEVGDDPLIDECWLEVV